MSSNAPPHQTPHHRNRQHHHRPHNSRSATSPMMALLTPIRRPPQQQQQQVIQRGDIATQTDQAAAAPADGVQHVQQQQQQQETNSTQPNPGQNDTERFPNAVDQQHQQQSLQLGRQMAREVKSSPQLLQSTTPNSEELRRELHDALVQNRQPLNAAADPPVLDQQQMRRSSHSAILDWLAYDSPHSPVDVNTEADQMGNQGVEDNPDDNNAVTELGPISSLSSIVNSGSVYSKIGSAVAWAITNFLYMWEFRLFRFLFVLLCIYFWLGFLERCAVAMTAAFVRWTWPPAHFILGSSRGTLYYLTDWFAWMDDFLSSWVCDMAIKYCRQYDVMCDCQCSFVSRTQRTASFSRRF